MTAANKLLLENSRTLIDAAEFGRDVENGLLLRGYHRVDRPTGRQGGLFVDP